MLVNQHFAPSHALLHTAVECIQVMEVAPMALARSIPNTRVDGWVVLEGSFEICSDESGTYRPVPLAGICPLRDKPLLFKTVEGFRALNFKCYPHLLSAPALAPLPSSSAALSFEHLFPRKEVAALLDVVRADVPDALKIRELEFFLARWLLSPMSPDDWLQSVMRSIWAAESGGVEHLAAHSFVSVKTLERRFHQQTGLKPKVFCKLARLQRTLKAIQQDTAGQVALPHVWQAGYYDQSHFIKDCRAITGLPPGRLFAQLPKLLTDIILTGTSLGCSSSTQG